MIIGMENPIIFSATDISFDELVLAGAYHPGSYYDPPEWDEVYKSVSEGLGFSEVYLVGHHAEWAAVTSDDTDDNLFNIVRRLAKGIVVMDAEMEVVYEYLEAEGTTEDKVWETLTERAQERLGDCRDYPDDD